VGHDEAEMIRREVEAESRATIFPLLTRKWCVTTDPDVDEEYLQMSWEPYMGAIQRLALWWQDHQHIPRHEVVAAAMNTLWLGLEQPGQLLLRPDSATRARPDGPQVRRRPLGLR
jgi:hypothetical protein